MTKRFLKGRAFKMRFEEINHRKLIGKLVRVKPTLGDEIIDPPRKRTNQDILNLSA